MKKTFQIIGLISLTCFSFFITEKTAIVINNMDEIMEEINVNKDKYKTEPKDAVIDGDNIIPGENGKVVNISKSYKNMKKNGYYSDKLYIYDYIKPNITINDNLDKYIVQGNSSRRMVSLIFVVKSGDNIDKILSIIDNYNIKATFFVDFEWFKNNNALVDKLINSSHLVSPFFEDYNDYNFEWMNMVLSKVNNQDVNFCYNINESKSNLEECKLKGLLTVKPIKISDKTPLVDIKEKLNSGSILSLNVNSETKKELSSIIIYIKSKGYIMTTLKENVLE